MLPNSIRELIRNLQALPGVGPKSARRMALHMLERNRPGAQRLAASIGDAMERVKRCEQCRNWSETPVCGICASEKRLSNVLCVVETPSEVMAIE